MSVRQKGGEISEDMQSKRGDLLEAMKEYHTAVSSTEDIEKAMSSVFNESVGFIKTVLLGISKRGDRYLRSLLVHGARSVVRLAENKDDGLSRWINKLRSKRGFNKTAVALANKMARIVWAIMSLNTVYRTV